MTYIEVSEKMINKEIDKAYRESWYDWTNKFIFFENGGIKITTCDWPVPYYPSKEDLEATDFKIKS